MSSTYGTCSHYRDHYADKVHYEAPGVHIRRGPVVSSPTEAEHLTQDDGMTLGDMATVLDTFPGQPLDFYGAMRAFVYDNEIRRWIEREVIDGSIVLEDSNLAELSQRLLDKYELNGWMLSDMMSVPSGNHEGHILVGRCTTCRYPQLADIAAKPWQMTMISNAIGGSGKQPSKQAEAPVWRSDNSQAKRRNGTEFIEHVLTNEAILVLACRDNLPQFEPATLTIETLLEEGHRLAREQESVRSHKLSEEYMKHSGSGMKSLIGLSG